MSPFASRTVPEHLLRGAGAITLGVLAAWLVASPNLLRTAAAFGAFGAALVLLRGCPMCWLAGLFETIAHAIRKDAAHD